jgi:hypothetical protein
VVAWTWQEKLAEMHEWNRVHRPNSWKEFLSAPIHPPSLVRHFGRSTYHSTVNSSWVLVFSALLYKFCCKWSGMVGFQLSCEL